MVTARVVREEGGELRSCVVSGHAGAGPKGGDIVCAAVSVLARTAYRTLVGRGGIVSRAEAPQRGEFLLEARPADGASEEDRLFLKAAGVFLIEGIQSVADEFPAFCKLQVETIKN